MHLVELRRWREICPTCLGDRYLTSYPVCRDNPERPEDDVGLCHDCCGTGEATCRCGAVDDVVWVRSSYGSPPRAKCLPCLDEAVDMGFDFDAPTLSLLHAYTWWEKGIHGG
jgi:hypothetical protein